MFFKKYGKKEVCVMGLSLRGLDRMLQISHVYHRVGCFFFRVKLFLFTERLGALIGTIGGRKCRRR